VDWTGLVAVPHRRWCSSTTSSTL